jgi:hypothetical protein
MVVGLERVPPILVRINEELKKKSGSSLENRDDKKIPVPVWETEMNVRGDPLC